MGNFHKQISPKYVTSLNLKFLKRQQNLCWDTEVDRIRVYVLSGSVICRRVFRKSGHCNINPTVRFQRYHFLLLILTASKTDSDVRNWHGAQGEKLQNLAILCKDSILVHRIKWDGKLIFFSVVTHRYTAKFVMMMMMMIIIIIITTKINCQGGSIFVDQRHIDAGRHTSSD
jgi:hypothetical protein